MSSKQTNQSKRWHPFSPIKTNNPKSTLPHSQNSKRRLLRLISQWTSRNSSASTSGTATSRRLWPSSSTVSSPVRASGNTQNSPRGRAGPTSRRRAATRCCTTRRSRKSTATSTRDQRPVATTEDPRRAGSPRCTRPGQPSSRRRAWRRSPSSRASGCCCDAVCYIM